MPSSLLCKCFTRFLDTKVSQLIIIQVLPYCLPEHRPYLFVYFHRNRENDSGLLHISRRRNVLQTL
jgi:hypothetical protein